MADEIGDEDDRRVPLGGAEMKLCRGCAGWPRRRSCRAPPSRRGECCASIAASVVGHEHEPRLHVLTLLEHGRAMLAQSGGAARALIGITRLRFVFVSLTSPPTPSWPAIMIVSRWRSTPALRRNRLSTRAIRVPLGNDANAILPGEKF